MGSLLFPASIRGKVLGSTPLLGGKAKREEEILAWLRMNRGSVDNAFVLDDEPSLFSDLRSRVFVVDGRLGIVADTVPELVAWLASKSN